MVPHARITRSMVAFALAVVLSITFPIAGSAEPGPSDGTESNLKPDVPTPAALPPNYNDVLVASGLSTPLGLGFTPDGRLLYTEQAGEIGWIDNGVVKVLHTVTGVETGSESGLFDVAVDPAFPTRPYLYVHYTNTNPQAIQIARFTFSDTGPNLAIDGASKMVWINDGPDGAFNHNGGGLTFDPAGMLVGAFGEDAEPCAAQARNQIQGKLIRMKVDATADPTNRRTLVPADNPFAANADDNAALVWIEGLRNPYQFDVDQVTKDIWVGDVGQNAWEEVDVFKPGDNGGWPYFEGNRVHQAGLCAGQSSIPPNVKPVYEYPNPAQGTSVMGLSVYRGKNYPNDGSWPPSMDGSFIFKDYYTSFLRVVRKNQTTGAYELVPGVTQTDFGSNYGRLTDMEIGPDGAAYYVNSVASGSVRKINYSGGGGNPPVITTASLPNGRVGATYSQTLAATGGSTPYTWSTTVGTLPAGLSLTASTGTISGTPTAAGTSPFTVRVSDSGAKTATKQLSITIDPPTATAPTAARSLTAAPGANLISLAWQAPTSDGGSAITNYRLYRGLTPGNLIFHTEIGNLLAFGDTSVTGGQNYCYQVAAKNAVAEGPKSNEACATPTGGNSTVPGPPINLAATPSTGRVDLTWTTPTSDGGKPITGYRLYRGTAPNPTVALQTLGAVTIFADTTVAGGTTYFYAVTALNQVGESARSNEVQASVPGGGINLPPKAAFAFAPTSPKVGDEVTFTDSSTDQDGTIGVWSWDFGDGSTAAVKSPKHAFTSDGQFTVVLTVTDNNGTSNEATKIVTVSKKDAPPPVNPPSPTILGIDQTMFLGIVLALVVAIAVVALLAARRRKRQPPAMQPWAGAGSAAPQQWAASNEQQYGGNQQGQWPPPGG